MAENHKQQKFNVDVKTIFIVKSFAIVLLFVCLLFISSYFPAIQFVTACFFPSFTHQAAIFSTGFSLLSHNSYGILYMGNLKFSTIVAHAPQNSSNFIWSGSPINWITSSASVRFTAVLLLFIVYVQLSFHCRANVCVRVVVFQQCIHLIYLRVCVYYLLRINFHRKTTSFRKSRVWTLYRISMHSVQCPIWMYLLRSSCRLTLEFSEPQKTF